MPYFGKPVDRVIKQGQNTVGSDAIIDDSVLPAKLDSTASYTVGGLAIDGLLQLGSSTSAPITSNSSPHIYRTNDTGVHEYGDLMIQGRSDLSRAVYITTGATPANRIKVSGDGDISFYEDTGTTAKFYWSAAAEQLRLGSTSDVFNTTYTEFMIIGDYTESQDNGITFLADAAGSSTIGFTDDTHSTLRGGITYHHSGDSMRFTTFTGERMRITSSGNVGIGTSSPSAKLHLKQTDGTASTGFKVVRYNNDNQYLSLWATGGSRYIDAIGDSSVSSSIRFRRSIDSGSTINESMRIQSDGSLLLGTDDGGASGAGDMVVNGGIYIGGNQAANYLDDYEEGTWSPTPRGSSSDPSGYTSNITGTYTKIGNKVWCNVNMTLNNDGSNGSGYFYINGFPFTPDDSQIFVVEGHNCERLMTDMRGEEIRPLLTSNRVLFYYGSDNTAGMNTLQWGTHVNTNLRFRVTFSYTI